MAIFFVALIHSLNRRTWNFFYAGVVCVLRSRETRRIIEFLSPEAEFEEKTGKLMNFAAGGRTMKREPENYRIGVPVNQNFRVSRGGGPNGSRKRGKRDPRG